MIAPVKILADECVSYRLIRELREKGHRIFTVYDLGLSGASDSRQLLGHLTIVEPPHFHTKPLAS